MISDQRNDALLRRAESPINQTFLHTNSSIRFLYAEKNAFVSDYFYVKTVLRELLSRLRSEVREFLFAKYGCQFAFLLVSHLRCKALLVRYERGSDG